MINIINDLDRDIAHILNTISKGYTIRNMTCSMYNIVKTSDKFAVIIEVKCFDCELRKKRKGYFALEYAYIKEHGYMAVSRYSRSMPIEIKKAANVPYGGWYKDERQKEAEELYKLKNGGL